MLFSPDKLSRPVPGASAALLFGFHFILEMYLVDTLGLDMGQRPRKRTILYG